MGLTTVKYPSKKTSAIFLLGFSTGMFAPQLFFNLISTALNSEIISSIAGNKAQLLSQTNMKERKTSEIIIYVAVIAGLSVGAYKIAGLLKQFFIGVAIGLTVRVILIGSGIEIPFTYDPNTITQTGQNATNTTVQMLGK